MSEEARVEEAVAFAAAKLRDCWVWAPIEDLITDADAGWLEAQQGLWEYADELTRAGEPLPLDIQQYVVRRARPGAPQPARRGRNPLSNLGRDLCVVGVIKAICDNGFRATRNAATERDSACSIVVTAMARNGVHMSERAVEKIWGRRAEGE